MSPGDTMEARGRNHPSLPAHDRGPQRLRQPCSPRNVPARCAGYQIDARSYELSHRTPVRAAGAALSSKQRGV